MDDLSDEWLTVRQAHELTGYNQDHIRRMLIAGVIDGRKFAHIWMVDRQSLLDYLDRALAKKAEGDPRFGPDA